MKTELAVVEKTKLTVVERAVMALNIDKNSLSKLVEESAEITVITNAAGYQQSQAAKMKLVKTRTATVAAGKLAREDLLAGQRAIIALVEEAVAITKPEEDRLQALQDEYQAKEEEKRQTKIRAEIARKAALQAKIDELDSGLKFGDSSDVIAEKLERVGLIEVDVSYQERQEEAHKLRAESIAELCEALEFVQQQEKIAAEQAAASAILRQQVEDERIKRIEADRVAAQLAELEAAAQVERDKNAEIARQEVEAKRKAEEKERFEAKQRADAHKAEEKRLADIERNAAAAPDRDRLRTYAEALIALKVPAMTTADGIAAANGIEKAILALHKRIIEKAEEL